MKNYRIIEISYLGATNTQGTRVKIKELTNGLNETKIISFNYKYDSLDDQAIEYIKGRGINIVGKSHTLNKSYIFSDSWDCNTQDNFISIK